MKNKEGKDKSMNIEELKKINQIRLNELIERKKTDNDNKIENDIEIHRRISDLLESDESIFFKMSMDDALVILSKLVSKEDLIEVYEKLMSAESYMKLKKNFKL